VAQVQGVFRVVDEVHPVLVRGQGQAEQPAFLATEAVHVSLLPVVDETYTGLDAMTRKNFPSPLARPFSTAV